MEFNFEKFVEDRKILIALGLFVVLGILIVLAFLRLSGGNKAKEELGKNQIRIQKGDEIVIVNENGLVEYRSGDKVFYRQWDAERTSSFFTKMRKKAKESKGKAPPAGECYTVTLWLDNELVSFCVSLDDEELNSELDDVFVEFGNEEGEDIGSYFDDDEDSPTNTPTLAPGTTATPTPTGIFSPTPTSGSTGGGSGGGGGNVPLPTEAGCSVWAGDIVGGKAIISTTLCTVLSPTPTP